MDKYSAKSLLGQRYIYKFFMGLLVAAIFILGLEIIFRLANPQFRSVNLPIFNKHNYIDSQIKCGFLVTDPHAFWRVAPNPTFGVNKAGFRNKMKSQASS